MQEWTTLPKGGREAKYGEARERVSRRKTLFNSPVRAELDATDRAIAAAIFAATLAYLWRFRRYTSMEPDESPERLAEGLRVGLPLDIQLDTIRRQLATAPGRRLMAATTERLGMTHAGKISGSEYTACF